MSEAKYQESIEQLYRQTLAQRVTSLSICSILPGHGSTSVLRALAQRHLLAGFSTLVVDLNWRNPCVYQVLPLESDQPVLEGKEEQRLAPQLVRIADAEAVFHGVPVVMDKSLMVRLRHPDVLKGQIEIWSSCYDSVLIDCCAVLDYHSESISPSMIAGACQASLLVLQSGRCNEHQIRTATQAFHQTGANLIGIVMNDQYHPRLIDELKRELRRLEFVSRRLSHWLIHKIEQFPLLSMNI